MSGSISSLDDANFLFSKGADRIVINRSLWDKPHVIKEISDRYGKQAIIASLDFKYINQSLFSYDWIRGETRSKFLPDFFEELIPYIGEILIQDVEQDGRVLGANIEAINIACKSFPDSMPIHIGSCGLVDWKQYSKLLKLNSVDAVCVSNIHHMSDKAIRALRKHCMISNIFIRNQCNIAADV